MAERGVRSAGSDSPLCSMDQSVGIFVFDSRDPLPVYASREQRLEAFAHPLGESLRVFGH